jgi:DNA (cytosine-5)-methyltransferase 1
MMMDYISLFSGIGGFELGIQKSNKADELNCIGYSEIEENAITIYNRHFPNHKNLGDVRKIRTEELPNFELLVGGFPCQSFSNSGKKQGFDDTRGTLFFEIARILKDKRPRYFLLENVQGLLWNKSGETMQTIIRILTEMGYHIEYEVLDSRFFGVPQRRERLFIKGYLGKRCEFKFPTIRRYSEPIKELSGEHLKIRTDTSKGYKEAEIGDGVRIDRLDQKGGGRGRVQTDSVGTLMCSCNWGVVTPDLEIRKLTPLEYERCQGFPDNWTKFGKDGELISDSQRYKCLGNAVTVPVIKDIFDNWDLKGE